MTEPVRIASRNVLAALAYPLGAPGALVCLWRAGDDPFVRFHAWQSILLTLVLVLVGTALRMVPLVGPPLALVAGGTLVGTALFLAARAYRGHWTAVPCSAIWRSRAFPPVFGAEASWPDRPADTIQVSRSQMRVKLAGGAYDRAC
ncbi:MAG: hypothetical protein ACREK5_04470 [Gemmatimonadota bacterium]